MVFSLLLLKVHKIKPVAHQVIVLEQHFRMSQILLFFLTGNVLVIKNSKFCTSLRNGQMLEFWELIKNP
ncbi:hypothetical protein P872_07575 [Rhodonellum psychrophilum GCM71 = DSM 17998]|uniref:Uncharacterized protein n=2 Tax=Rhodonellum TaxID=336827 RepID=U5BZB3_9BACT|nr:hypothetical protein P872_07575 [Rhodonellum psychrophilum GCM71 = DSM 17998]SDZ32096.1 hypothetical protein SAMN05444412_11056 [Rhodonellum ikkaensis]